MSSSAAVPQEEVQRKEIVLDEELELIQELETLQVSKIKTEVELVDIMEGAQRWEVCVTEDKKGMIALVDCMPRLVPKGQTGDYAIVQAARVSYGIGTKKSSEDKGLIRYLCRHRHTTPFEMVEFKFHCSMPVFVARQWIRHRTANVNEYSARYSVMPDKFYRPKLEELKKQSASNKQGGDALLDGLTAQQFLDYLDNVEKMSYSCYQELIEKGVSREQARIGLPVNIYTEWYWKCDLHNTLHFLTLRMDKHAQREIREFALAMFKLVKDIVPMAAEAFIDYRFGAMLLSKLEVEAIQGKNKQLAVSNKRENEEFQEKLKKLHLEL